MSRYYKRLIKNLRLEITSLSDRDAWRERALAAERRADKLDMASTYASNESARIGMDAMARLHASDLATYYCAQCDRNTIHENQICIGCGVKTLEGTV